MQKYGYEPAARLYNESMPKKKNETAFATLQEIIRRDAQRDGFTGEPESKHEKLKYRVDAGTKGAGVRMEKLSP